MSSILVPSEDALTHTVAHPECADPECVCHRFEYERSLQQQVQDGLLTTNEAEFLAEYAAAQTAEVSHG